MNLKEKVVVKDIVKEAKPMKVVIKTHTPAKYVSNAMKEKLIRSNLFFR